METLDELEEEYEDCQKCDLCENRTQVVFGEGDPDADLMFVGEAPGRNEDEEGRPFIGRAGKMLTEMIEKVPLEREEVYITNTVLCRPRNNRDPEQEEIQACSSRLKKQIQLVEPEALVAVGRFAGNKLVGAYGASMKELASGTDWAYKDGDLTVPVVPIYHPSYLLRLVNMDEEKAQNIIQDSVDRIRGVLD